MKILSRILSWLYGLTVGVRNLLYDEHIFYSHSVSVPTICIGNLAVGGTGKTPHTEFIARELSKHFRVAILSRGYRRKSRGFVLADEHSTVLTIGDEPMQMHLNMPEIVLAVCENRVYGIRRLVRMFPDLQVVVLDDAFQHRSLSCGFNILLTAADNLYVNDSFLPYGTLRDSRYSALRANMIVVTKCKEDLRPIDRRVIATSLRIPQYQQLFFSYLKYSVLRRFNPSDDNTESFAGKKPLLLTGIADAGAITEYVRSQYGEPITLAFPDHHAYKKADFGKIKKIVQQTGVDFIITTQKDAVRLAEADMPEELAKLTMVLPVEVDLRDCEQDFMRPIIRYVTENCRANSKTPQRK